MGDGHITRRWALAAGIAAAIGTFGGLTMAQSGDYPQAHIKLIVAYAPGGGTDVMARLFGQELARLLKTSVIVENKGGGGGIIGAQAVATAAPDGYTLLFTAMAELTIPNLASATVPYSLDSFAPVGRIAFSPFVLLANKQLPVSSVKELLAYGTNPRRSMSIAAPANYSYLTGGLLKLETGLDLEVVRYRGSGPAMTDVIAGNVPIGFDTIGVSLPHMRSGNVKPLAVASDKRSSLASDLPTMAEAGFPAIVGGAWYGLVAPKGTPAPVIEKLRGAIADALASPDFSKRLMEQGFEPFSNDTPAAFKKFLKDDTVKWTNVADKVGFK